MRTTIIPHDRFGLVLVLFLLTLGLPKSVLQGQLVGSVDDFQSGLDGWDSGPVNPTPPVLVSDVGPGGAGDHAMQVTAGGVGTAGRALVAFNRSQWTGDYLSAGVSSITMELRNTGATPLSLRLALRGSDLSTWFVTTLTYNLPTGGGWQSAQFSLGESSVTRVQGTQSYGVTFADVTEIRLLNNAAPDLRGGSVSATLLVDNIAAVPEPASTAAVLGLTALAAAVYLRRSKAH